MAFSFAPNCIGKYGEWSAWGACSESCQSNLNVFPSQTQTRQCLGASLNSGCPGKSSQTQTAILECFISAWEAWGPCSASCQLSFNSPTQTRNRQCFGATFNGNCNGAVLTDTLNCNQQVSCPGYLTDWTSWSICLATCQQTDDQYNFSYRSRKCVGASFTGNCGGALLTDQTPCTNNVPCPGYLTDWTSWSICLATCQQTDDQYNFSYRSRKCVGASFTGNCGGALLTDQTPCTNNVPCPVSRTWSHWYTSSANSRVNVIQSSLVYLVVLVVLCIHLFSDLFKLI
ncbi:adhesion G protein-coupled receptor B1-like [Hydra vulgaris]|uniref:Adhesion G protein-coupled receptor B1-like n=1 Tax=Hydra vulgaris TaxID=6087 RepID=A0ABM4CRM4_HYDVU